VDELSRELRSSELDPDRSRRQDELNRRFGATAISVTALIATGLCGAAMIWFPAWPTDVLRTAFAGCFASFVVMAARAIDGPLGFASPRRGTGGHSDAVALGLVWLGWFAAITAALLLAGLKPTRHGAAEITMAAPACRTTCTAKASGSQASISCVQAAANGARPC
jgi:hypothetical protein